MFVGWNSVAVTNTSYIADISSKKIPDIHATIEFGLTLKRLYDLTRTYSKMHRTDMYSHLRSIILSVLPNVWMFVYELSGCEFQSTCSHLNFRYCACFEQGVLWYSGSYRAWSRSTTRMWHDYNIQLNAPYRWELTTELNHLVSLTKGLSVRLQTKWCWLRFQVQPLKFQIIESGYTLKRVRDMTRTHSQMHRTNKYSQLSSNIWSVLTNVSVFVYELSNCGFHFTGSHLRQL